YVPRELFPDDGYPPYCFGPSYLLSSDAVADVLFGARLVRAFPSEDSLYTGVIVEKMGIQKSAQND
ncbi:hypothetical protein AAVH_07658, partial [Aphelenchoides avenae]